MGESSLQSGMVALWGALPQSRELLSRLPLNCSLPRFIKGSEMPSSRSISNKVGVPNAYFTLPSFAHNQTTEAR